jgi:hypothetical protein
VQAGNDGGGMNIIATILGYVVLFAVLNYVWILIGRLTWGPLIRRYVYRQIKRKNTNAIPDWSFKLDLFLSGPLAWTVAAYEAVEARR